MSSFPTMRLTNPHGEFRQTPCISRLGMSPAAEMRVMNAECKTPCMSCFASSGRARKMRGAGMFLRPAEFASSPHPFLSLVIV